MQSSSELLRFHFRLRIEIGPGNPRNFCLMLPKLADPTVWIEADERARVRRCTNVQRVKEIDFLRIQRLGSRYDLPIPWCR
jgi:hypothetical protein